jgi:hypothetical protein
MLNLYIVYLYIVYRYRYTIHRFPESVQRVHRVHHLHRVHRVRRGPWSRLTAGLLAIPGGAARGPPGVARDLTIRMVEGEYRVDVPGPATGVRVRLGPGRAVPESPGGPG